MDKKAIAAASGVIGLLIGGVIGFKSAPVNGQAADTPTKSESPPPPRVTGRRMEATFPSSSTTKTFTVKWEDFLKTTTLEVSCEGKSYTFEIHLSKRHESRRYISNYRRLTLNPTIRSIRSLA